MEEETGLNPIMRIRWLDTFLWLIVCVSIFWVVKGNIAYATYTLLLAVFIALMRLAIAISYILMLMRHTFSIASIFDDYVENNEESGDESNGTYL